MSASSGRRALSLAGLLSFGALAAASSRAADPEDPPAPFTEVAAESGLHFRHWNGMTGRMYYSEVMGAGGALFDADGDGDLDVFLVQGSLLAASETLADAVSPPPPGGLRGRLYLNDGGERELRFRDATAESGLDARGYGMGAATGDVDGDGRTDLLLTYLGKVELWRALGGGRFENASVHAGLEDSRWSTGASFFDYDRDGDLDLYLVRYLDFDARSHSPCHDASSMQIYCGPATYRPLTDRLLRNRGDGRFEDVSIAAGIAGHAGPGLGVLALDVDDDGWLDLFVANDGAPNFLWRNRGDGSFEEIAAPTGCAVSPTGAARAGMGVAAGDVDRDGDEDLLVTNLEGETHALFLTAAVAGGALLVEGTAAAGLAGPSLPYTGFGAGFLDADRDGRLELVVASGAIRPLSELVRRGDPYPLHQRNQFYRPSAPGRFRDATPEAGAAFQLSEVSRGLMLGDLDSDGDTDVVITNSNGPVRLLRNDAPPAHWLGMRLVVASPGGAPRDALGALATLLVAGAPPLVRRARSDGSYLSASDPRLLVGLGEREGPAMVEVRWPSGASERFGPLPVDRYHTLRAGEGRPHTLDDDDAERPSAVRAEAGPAVAPGPAAAAAPPATPELSDPAPASVLVLVPEPESSALEPKVAAQLAQARAGVASILALDRLPLQISAVPVKRRPELGALFGVLGRAYHAYRFLDAAVAAYDNALALSPGESAGSHESATTAYLLGVAALERGDLTTARRGLEAALALAPADSPARLRLAQVELLAGDLDAAAAALSALREQDPDLVYAYVLSAELEAQRGDPAAAAAHYRAALRRDPAATALHYPLALALRAAGDPAAASAHLALRGEGAPRLFDPRLAALDELRQGAAAWRERAQAALALGRTGDAVVAYRAALAEQPLHAALWASLGAALVRDDDAAAALQALERALELEPGNGLAHYNLGVIARRAGDDQSAAAHYRRALAADPRRVDARLNLANSLRRLGQLDAALAQYRRAAEIDPLHAPARLGEVLVLAEQDRFDEAVAAVEAARQLLADDTALLVAHARLLATTPERAPRDSPQALALAEQAFARARTLDSVEALAMAYAAAGNAAVAVRWQETAIEVAQRAGRLADEPQLLSNLERYRSGLPAARPWRAPGLANGQELKRGVP